MPSLRDERSSQHALAERPVRVAGPGQGHAPAFDVSDDSFRRVAVARRVIGLATIERRGRAGRARVLGHEKTRRVGSRPRHP
jgi:hypothetical protein